MGISLYALILIVASHKGNYNPFFVKKFIVSTKGKELCSVGAFPANISNPIVYKKHIVRRRPYI